MQKKTISIILIFVFILLYVNSSTATTNTSPTPPTISVQTTGQKDIEYNCSVISTDPDNDTICYIIDWGDTTNTNSSFFANGTAYATSHAWTISGIYIIESYAKDVNNASSATTRLKVMIDTKYVHEIGYLIDNNSDGNYDYFHSNETNNETIVEKQTNGTYLIDSNGNGKWNYTYDPNTDALAPYATGEGTSVFITVNNAVWYALTIGTIIGIILLIVIYLITNRRKADE
jgi:sensor c-di-GMP phosphodiesterase-like protein